MAGGTIAQAAPKATRVITVDRCARMVRFPKVVPRRREAPSDRLDRRADAERPALDNAIA
ncbi:hypothetical protein GCM10010983_35160 [Caulobacter rhizosphaerae]|nr:hypothetical protein GCM10010983_35160 [Caulobacter rhizosphaerae]